jgi:hypothetical protein
MFRSAVASCALVTVCGTSLLSCSTSIPGLREWADPIIGHPIAIIRENDQRPGSYASRIGWQEKTYELDNCNWVYVHPDRPACEIHFEVGTDGNVVGYRPVGEGCRHQ